MDDFELPPRVVGLETEFAWRYKTPEGHVDPTLSIEKRDETVMKLLPDYVASHRYGYNNRFLGNGAKYYYDMGKLWEYATPECLSFDDVATYDIAGERYLVDHMQRAIEEEVFTDVFISKRVSDHQAKPSTAGAHENYSVDADVFSEVTSMEHASLAAQYLAVHLVTRSIFTGAGSVDDNGTFMMTQKLRNLGALTSHTTTGISKPIINTRDQSHMNSELGLGRLHLISGDANVSPWANWMKFGTTSIVLRLLEHGMFPESLVLDNPVEAAKTVGSADTVQTMVRLKGGTTMSALEIQQQILHAAEILADKYKLPGEEQEVLNEWAEALTDLEVDQNRCSDRIDWINRQHLIEGRSADDQYGRKKADIGFDLCYPSMGVALRLRQLGKYRRTPSEPRINAALILPPSNTRALVRGDCVDRFARAKRGFSVDWHVLKLVDNGGYLLDNPLDTDLDRFHSWLPASMQ